MVTSLNPQLLDERRKKEKSVESRYEYFAPLPHLLKKRELNEIVLEQNTSREAGRVGMHAS